MDVHRIDCENLDIRAWAKEVHQIKIRELKELIAEKQKAYDAFKVLVNTDPHTAAQIVCESALTASDIIRLNLKLDILQKR
jgi:hypothetical protein